MVVATGPHLGPREWVLLGALSLLWGGSFFLVAIALRGLPPFTLVALRVGLAVASLLLLLRLSGSGLPRGRAVWLACLGMGLLNNAIPFSLIVWGQTQIASGLAAILNATTPLATVLVAHLCTQDERLTASRLMGVVAGLVGVAVMNLGINLVQFVPLMAVTLRMAMDGPETRRTLAALSGTLLIGVGAVSAGVALSNWLVTQGWNWGFLVGAPLLMVVVSAAVVGLGLSPMPHLFSRIKALGRKV